MEEEEDEVRFVLQLIDWGNWFCTFWKRGGPRQLGACCMARVMAVRCGAACQPTAERRRAHAMQPACSGHGGSVEALQASSCSGAAAWVWMAAAAEAAVAAEQLRCA